MTKNKDQAVATRAEKKDATKILIKAALEKSPVKHNELLDSVAKTYTEKFGSETDNANDVKGRVGSVLDIMKKEGEVVNEGGMYALKPREPEKNAPSAPTETEQKPAETLVKKRGRKPKAEAVAEVKTEVKTEEPAAEPAPKKRGRKSKSETIAEVQAEQKAEEPAAEPAPKKRGRKPKAEMVAEVKTEEKAEPQPEVKAVAEVKPEVKAEVKLEPQPEQKTEQKPEQSLVVKTKGELAKKSEVMDMSFLFSAPKTDRAERKDERKPETKAEQKPETKTETQPVAPVQTAAERKEERKEERKDERKEERKPELQTELPEKGAKSPQNAAQSQNKDTRSAQTQTAQNGAKQRQNARLVKSVKKPQKPMTADEKLKDAFLKKLRSLGGDYFEYYSVYLLEVYSRKNGRRLEGLRVCGGDNDGGIDGEIELTDGFGFRETIYIQSKNWDPDRGDERLWVVGETLLQQFIGACACKQAKQGKQHTRGVFMTTSNFTPEAKRLLETMSDKIVGYDGNDVFETAKESQFGLVCENGVWKLDEQLLSGPKAFFHM